MERDGVELPLSRILSTYALNPHTQRISSVQELTEMPLSLAQPVISFTRPLLGLAQPLLPALQEAAK